MTENARSIAPITCLLDEYREKAKSNVDHALCALLTRFQDDLPELDHYFHKAFRQCDCVDVEAGGHMDLAIWCLLDESKLFWTLFEKYANKL